LAGEDADASLAVMFPERFSDERERELWWQTGCRQLSRARALPTLEAEESRREIAALVRFVIAADDGGDRVVALGEVAAHAAEPIVAAELQRRAAELSRLLPALHPFFLNAGLSLAAVLSPELGQAARLEALQAYDRDWSDAIELQQASRAALDELERRGERRVGGPG
jgi:hypothetical protein